MFCGCLNIKKRQICSDENISYGDGQISNSSNYKSEYVNKLTPNSKQNNTTQSSSRGFFSFVRRRKKTRNGGSKEELRMSKVFFEKYFLFKIFVFLSRSLHH